MSIRITKGGNRIHATGKDAAALFKALTANPNQPEPKGFKFYSQSMKKQMMLVQDEASSWNGWIVYKHPDGQWVSLRKATDADHLELANAVSKAHHES